MISNVNRWHILNSYGSSSSWSVAQCACTVLLSGTDEISWPLARVTPRQVNCSFVHQVLRAVILKRKKHCCSGVLVTGWSKTGYRLQRTWRRRWKCQTPHGRRTCTSAVWRHSYSRLCNGHHLNPHSGSGSGKADDNQLLLKHYRLLFSMF